MRMTDDTPMPFGKHKGRRLEDVPANYLLWLGSNLEPTDQTRTALLHYIVENQAALEHEVLQRQQSGDEID